MALIMLLRIWLLVLTSCQQFISVSLTQSILVAKAYLYSAPQPLTKLMRMVHILVSWYTASNPWLTDCANNAANSWLLKIFRLHPERNNQDKTKRQVNSWSLSPLLFTGFAIFKEGVQLLVWLIDRGTNFTNLVRGTAAYSSFLWL